MDTRWAFFVDRDGTVIVDQDYPSDPTGVKLLDGAAASIARLNELNIPVIMVTNQSGIGRGYFPEHDYLRVHRRVIEVLESAGASVTDTYYCPHSPDQEPPCECRKPSPGMFEAAAERYGLDLNNSVYVGDRLRDVLAGVDKGGRAFLIRAGRAEDEAQRPSEVELVDSLREAVDRVLESLKTD